VEASAVGPGIRRNCRYFSLRPDALRPMNQREGKPRREVPQPYGVRTRCDRICASGKPSGLATGGNALSCVARAEPKGLDDRRQEMCAERQFTRGTRRLPAKVPPTIAVEPDFMSGSRRERSCGGLAPGRGSVWPLPRRSLRPWRPPWRAGPWLPRRRFVRGSTPGLSESKRRRL
jgi:hypothetical protein